MSQEKVDKYKKEKGNRKKSSRKDRAKQILSRIAVGAVGLAMVVWIGYSVRLTYEENKPKESVAINYSAVTDYQTSVYQAEDGE